MCFNIKKIISVFLTVAMLFSFSGISVLAEEVETGTETVEIIEQPQTENDEEIISGEISENAETQMQDDLEENDEETKENDIDEGEDKAENVERTSALESDIALMSVTSLSGLGTSESPYLVYTEDELIALATGKTDNALSAYYELQNDIIITSDTWTPIGAETAFTGVFDGKGHTISGISLFQSTGLSGLFGNNNGVIKNLGVDVFISNAATTIGALVGQNSGTIEKCFSTGTITSTSQYAGGLVGINTGNILECYSDTYVSGKSYVGGLIGQNNLGTIISSYASGDISGYEYVGGLVGRNYCGTNNATATIQYCYADGNVNGMYSVGGLVGENCAHSTYNTAVIEYSYAHGNVTGSYTVGGFVGTNKIISSGGNPLIVYCYATGIVNDGSGFGFAASNDGTIRYSYYNSINAGNKIGFAATSSNLTNQYIYYGWDFENIWGISNNGNYPYIKCATVSPKTQINGNGSKSSPYIIENEEQLIALVNGELPKSSGVYYELGNDISVTARHWTPIGSNGTDSFAGIFDGKGYTISGVSLSNSEYSYIGLFGENTGTIKNLNVSVSIEGVYFVGGIAGSNSGTIDNCSVSGTVSGVDSCQNTGGLVGRNSGIVSNSNSSAIVTSTYQSAGGLVGYNEGTVTFSYATGNVSGKDYVGGLVGRNYCHTSGATAVVRYCYAKGAVTATGYAGGLIGENYAYGTNNTALIEYSYAHGNVTGTSYSGGLVGSNNRYNNGGQSKISYCYAVGNISCNNKGGLAGYNSGTITSSYYNSTTSNCSDIDKGTPLSDDAMKIQTSYVGWDFSNIWAINNSYPYLIKLTPIETISVTGVTINKSTLSLVEGSSETLSATITPENATNKTVLWTSSNTAVATVLNGKVTAKSAGTAVITATTADGGYTASCTVTVTEKAPTVISVTGVTLNKSAVSLEEGKTETLTATVLPTNATNKDVTWKSSAPGVASVSNGVVTALKAGTAVITVTTADGGFTASCTVTVTAKPIDENTPKIMIKDIKARPGKEIDVTVELENNKGFVDMGIEIGYNSDVMTLTNVTPNSGVGGTFTPAQTYAVNPFNMGWSNTANITYNGNLATLTFKIADDAADGIYPITLDYYKGRNGNYVDGEDVNYDENDNAVGFVYISGSVIVASYIPGDINGDEKVNNKDATFLLRYLAGWSVDGVNTDALDTDGSETVNNKDATLLLRYLAGWSVTLH